MGVQQLLLSYGAGAKKTYIDSIFDNTVYTGVSGSGVQLTNGIDMSGEKGMVWVKSRSLAKSWYVFDNVSNTAQGSNPNNSLYLNNTTVTPVNNTAYQVTMNNNGVTSPTTDDSDLGGNGDTYYMPMFRQAPGFFDIVTYTGDGATSRNIAHSLGSIPGMILIKNLSDAQDWAVYNRTISASKYLSLNKNDGSNNGSEWFADGTEPTASVFSVGNQSRVNSNGDNYVAYIFAGGESTAATARSVLFDGSNDYLSIADSSDFDIGTNWTAECWFRTDSYPSSWQGLIGQWGTGEPGWILEFDNPNLKFYYKDSGGTTRIKTVGNPGLGKWNHVAVSKEGTTTRIFLNGIQTETCTDLPSLSVTSEFQIGYGGNGYYDGYISNVRIVKGTAVYTSSFRPPTEPLTNITNTVLLCCNSSSQTGSTVTPGTITNNGGSIAATTSPFDDPAGFIFGENEDQNVIKCGGYKGNGSTTGPEIYLGWEPSFLLVKNTSSSESWLLLDSMRGMITGGSDAAMEPHDAAAEYSMEWIELTSTGFKVVQTHDMINGDNENYIYMAIRKPDFAVGKPAKSGTDVFSLADSAGGTTIPNVTTGFPVEFAFGRSTGTMNWTAAARQMGERYLTLNDSSNSEQSWNGARFDSNTGWGYDVASTWKTWNWKSHAGFEVRPYKGSGTAGNTIRHGLGRSPEMIWLRSRSSGEPWPVYHKGVNGGTNPQNYYLQLNSTMAESEFIGTLNNYAPTATDFQLGYHGWVNTSGNDYLAILFASVDKISKVGSYTGSGSTGFSVTTGFSPRFIIIKRVDSEDYWAVFDTLRGLASGNDSMLKLNSNAAEITGNDIIDPTSTGFDIVSTDGALNGSNGKYIYYAHA